jgi:hypothetical protein
MFLPQKNLKYHDLHIEKAATAKASRTVIPLL